MFKKGLYKERGKITAKQCIKTKLGSNWQSKTVYMDDYEKNRAKKHLLKDKNQVLID